ncbi:alpha/beta hydrolase [Companilactobacillus alimentarius]|uniref:Uncharacterized protein n=3 Tax=Companilactobacillus alimentarius TaxID=1602 RepID=A0A2K9HKF2_9LACO|nr:alpha/beta hydrolase [Companilactobacillus alimentarius]AUI72316.1 hypothetical protein LA20249_09030 [Companilactobacillus alimentarius DSM 20249]KRK75752.1 hypothetical protein FC67_GL000837 [Companilactobacillus alimentarius DSM 20249]MDT6952896.1 alpha/beta hydrolase [Companilactobacillus alimentarius]
MTPDTGEIDFPLITSTAVEALKKSGPSVLMTHSQGGVPGWMIGSASDDVTAIIAIEPGAFVFPKEEVPEKIVTKYPMAIEGIPVSDDDYVSLIKKPIVVYFGDNIPSEPSKVPAWDFWRGSEGAEYYFDYKRGAAVNRVEFVSWSQLDWQEFHPTEIVKDLKQPYLMICGENAFTRPGAEVMFKNAGSENKKLVIIPKARHFDLYDGEDYVPTAIENITEFLQKNI